jgi:tetratricopeptide (TPR) repeat protein
MKKLILVFLIIPGIIIAQSKLDSLQNLLETSTGEQKFSLLMTIIEKIYNKEPKQALQYSLEALQMAERVDNKHWKAKAYNEIGRSYMGFGKYDSAIIFHRKSLNIRQKLGDKDKAAESFEKIGSCNFKLGNYNLALKNYQDALVLNRETGNRKWESRDISEIGYIYKTISEYDKAIEYYQRALKISEEINEDRQTANIMNRIGSVYSKIGNNNKALEYFKLSLKIREEVGYTWGVAGSLNNIGSVYNKLNKNDLALEYFFKALEINEELGNTQWKSYNLNNIGSTFKLKGEYSKALQYFTKSLKIKEKRGDKKGIANTYTGIGELYILLKNYNKAIEYFIKSLYLAEEIGVKDKIRDCYLSLSETYSLTGDYKKALEYSNLYSAIKDSILNDEKFKTITEIQTKYETEKKEKENELLKKDLSIKEKNEQILLFKQGLMFVIILALFVLVILIFFLLRLKSKSLKNSKILFEQEKKLNDLELKNKEREKQHLEELVFAEQQINNLQKEKIQHKNRELSTITLHILNKNKILSEIKNEIEIVELSKISDTSSCSKILNLIEGNQVLDQDWEQFKKHFEEVHKGFFEKLNRNYKGFTQNDMKLCAYLRINLSSKEIAKILNITPDSMKKSRHRLRKKLDINPEDDLVEFMNKI